MGKSVGGVSVPPPRLDGKEAFRCALQHEVLTRVGLDLEPELKRPWWCCVTVFPNHGIRGAISCMRSQKLDSMRSRQICEATGRRIAQNNSIGTRCSILLAT